MPRSIALGRLLLTAALSSLPLAGFANAPASPASTSTPADDGSVTVPGFRVPFSSYASPEARRQFAIMRAQSLQAPPLTQAVSGDVGPSRAYYAAINQARVRRMRTIYPVRIHAARIAGVPVQIVEPAQGVVAAQRQRVLINLHGGAFLWGAQAGGLVESIPVASVGRVQVIAVDYRQGPEHRFPAASDDVEAVYRALLKTHAARNIGIYGCSSGGILTGEVVARLIVDKLPVPSAIGIFCAGLTRFGGDSAFVAPVLDGDPPVSAAPDLLQLPYFKGARADDPLVFPGLSPVLLAKFPPTLLISGSRDFSFSAELEAQQLLTAAGVETELHLWDGMWHAFFADPDLPESRQAYAVMAKFFATHLGR